ncbi:hypothetical protein KY289_018790 [Solanum tuberosum]|nr:hypothetical protein KY289_018790 [Solanum tuberosum]
MTMVPSEGEFATGKRMDQGISEPEGSRKKKKKQVATPHPTCSWVHLRPQRWKLMGPEEKVKYTTRACKVWDKYLSRVPVHESEVSRENRSISGEDPDQNLEGSRVNGSISVTLLDPDVLDCPICFEHLCVPVFQCENGHIACASCCIKIANKCPSCCLPIGYNRCRAMENVLESLKVSCVNNRYGCKEILSYSKNTEHENACIYVPCLCPSHGCDFIGTSAKVYAHFSDKHASSAEHIFFNAVHPIYIEKDQRYKILQMRTEGILFIINHASDRGGSAINIICVGPARQKRRFSYKLVVTDGESSFKLESVAECIPNWSENSPLKKFLVVPRDVVNSSAPLKLNVFIEEKE